MDAEFMVVLVTVGSRSEGENMARQLVENRLAACVNIVGPIRSVYVWEGDIAEDDEHLLIIKTRGEVLRALEARVREMHSYDVPEVVGLPIIDGSTPYLDWLRAATTGATLGS